MKPPTLEQRAELLRLRRFTLYTNNSFAHILERRLRNYQDLIDRQQALIKDLLEERNNA